MRIRIFNSFAQGMGIFIQKRINVLSRGNGNNLQIISPMKMFATRFPLSSFFFFPIGNQIEDLFFFHYYVPLF